MKELSLNILDIAENSLKAGATLVGIDVTEEKDTLTVTVSDNGCGMTEEFLKTVTDPFSTTRTTRKVGLGIPLLKMEAEQTGGSFSIMSRCEAEYKSDHGTVTSAVFYKDHIDMTPLGDINATVMTLLQCAPDVDLVFSHKTPYYTVALDTRQIKEILGDVPVNSPEVMSWIKDYLYEQQQNI